MGDFSILKEPPDPVGGLERRELHPPSSVWSTGPHRDLVDPLQVPAASVVAGRREPVGLLPVTRTSHRHGAHRDVRIVSHVLRATARFVHAALHRRHDSDEADGRTRRDRVGDVIVTVRTNDSDSEELLPIARPHLDPGRELLDLQVLVAALVLHHEQHRRRSEAATGRNRDERDDRRRADGHRRGRRGRSLRRSRRHGRRLRCASLRELRLQTGDQDALGRVVVARPIGQRGRHGLCGSPRRADLGGAGAGDERRDENHENRSDHGNLLEKILTRTTNFNLLLLLRGLRVEPPLQLQDVLVLCAIHRGDARRRRPRAHAHGRLNALRVRDRLILRPVAAVEHDGAGVRRHDHAEAVAWHHHAATRHHAAAGRARGPIPTVRIRERAVRVHVLRHAVRVPRDRVDDLGPLGRAIPRAVAHDPVSVRGERPRSRGARARDGEDSKSNDDQRDNRLLHNFLLECRATPLKTSPRAPE